MTSKIKEMTRAITILLAALASAALLQSVSACGSLDVDPGADLAVQITAEEPLDFRQALGPVPVHVDVTGCDSYDASMQFACTSSDSQGPCLLGVRFAELSPTPIAVDDNGVWLADAATITKGVVDIERADERWPFTAEIEVLIECTHDSRTARSNHLSMQYAPASKVAFAPPGNIYALFDLGDGGVFAVGDGWVGRTNDNLIQWEPQFLYELVGVQRFYGDPDNPSGPVMLMEHQFVRNGDVGYVSVGCPTLDCGKVSVDGQDVSATLVYEVSMQTTYTVDSDGTPYTKTWGPVAMGQRQVAIPGVVVGMLAEPSDTLVLSDTDQGTVITRIDVSGATSSLVFADEHVLGAATTVDGDLEFLTVESAASALRLRTTAQADALWQGTPPAETPLRTGSVSPDGTHFSVEAGEHLWLGGIGVDWLALATDLAASPDPSGSLAQSCGSPHSVSVWTATGLAISGRCDGHFGVDVFDLVSPNAARYQFREWVPPTTNGTALRGWQIAVMPGSDEIVATNYGAFRLLDRNGTVVGASALLNITNSGRPVLLTRTDATATLPVFTASGSLLYLFDLTRYADQTE